ncbi:MAG: hypothetical protein HY709_08655 [Candidatus Latescibacteria bacterium]|nr:hypothetical protein [Candidatus Latescibacterota bacterium]
MRYVSILFLSVVVALAFCGPVAAHLFGPNGEGNPWYMPAIPDQAVPRIDGNLDDWSWFPSRWVFTTEEFIPWGSFDAEEQKVPKDDWDGILYGPAWVPSANMIMWAVKVTDDIPYAPYTHEGPDGLEWSWKMDGGQFVTDADHGGDVRGTSTEFQQNYYTIANGGDIGIFNDEDMMEWAYEPPHAFFGFSPVQGNGSYEAEIAYTLWDHLDPAGEGASRKHTLEVGEIIGFSISVYDRDSEEEQGPAVSFHFGNSSQGGQNIPDWQLLPVEETLIALQEEGKSLPSAVEASTWGRIKSTFTK